MKSLSPLKLPGHCGRDMLLIAGPCSAETEDQVLRTARGLSDIGIGIFRAGLWKPRTRPGCFEGVGSRGLPWLRRVKDETGMLISTEVATRRHVEEALKGGVDILWIGARTTANPFAMQEIADVLKEAQAFDMPILVKNPVNPDIELWIGALQRLYNAGIRRLGAVHRGFSVYGAHIYRNMPEWKIAIDLRLRYPELPIIVDPSHIGGKRELIAPLSQQALDMGFNGLMIESHCAPDSAWSDASQQVTPEELEKIIGGLVVRDSTQTPEKLVMLREQIDTLDNELLEVLGKRLQICREIGLYKRDHRMPAVQTDRFNEIIKDRVALARQMGLGAEFMRTVLLAIHEESVRQQIAVISERRTN